MCIQVDRYREAKDEGKTETRWKFLALKGIELESPYAEFPWKRKNNKAENARITDSNAGFHVYLNKEDAINGAKTWSESNIDNYVVVELKVSHFLAEGIIWGCDDYSDGKRAETWRKADILEVYDLSGKNITKKIFKNG